MGWGVLGDIAGGISDGVKWVAGKVADGAKRAWQGLSKLGGLIKEGIGRLITSWEWVACQFGYRGQKHLRIKVYLLQEAGTPVCAIEQANDWVRAAIDIFERTANVQITTVGNTDGFVEVFPGNAPEHVLNPSFGFLGLKSLFSDADKWFSSRALSGGHLLDWGDPVTTFVVRAIEGKGGYAIPGANYCIVDSECSITTLAHELGHVCLLPHYKPGPVIVDGIDPEQNLMNPGRKRAKDVWLDPSQVCTLRNSRFVTFDAHGSSKKPTNPGLEDDEDQIRPRSDWVWLLW